MKYLLATLTIIVTMVTILTFSGVANALSPAYRAVFCYPTGTYWAHQVAAYPDYYAAHNAFYTARYGATTRYCI